MRDYEELFGPATRVTSVVDEPLQECFLDKGYVFAHETAQLLMAPRRESRATTAAVMEDLAA